MKSLLLALVVLLASACGSTKAAPAGPCPERTEPLAGSSCPTEGTRCEYVVTASCQTDEYLCTDGKWATQGTPNAPAGCAHLPHAGDAGEGDGGADAADAGPDVADAADAAAE